MYDLAINTIKPLMKINKGNYHKEKLFDNNQESESLSKEKENNFTLRSDSVSTDESFECINYKNVDSLSINTEKTTEIIKEIYSLQSN